MVFFNEGECHKEAQIKRRIPSEKPLGESKTSSILPGVPIIALTASVLLKDRHKVIKASGVHNPVIIDVSPNKENISLHFQEMKNESCWFKASVDS